MSAQCDLRVTEFGTARVVGAMGFELGERTLTSASVCARPATRLQTECAKASNNPPGISYWFAIHYYTCKVK